MSIANVIESLRKTIRLHNYKYYTLSNPSISDAQYDELMRRLRKLEETHPEYASPDSPTQTVGSIHFSEGFSKITRTKPMLSIQDVFDLDGVNKLIESSNSNYVVEHKIDGLGVELVYIDGILATASTRGDGITGEDVTKNILAVHDIPVRLPVSIPRMEIRGEVYMRYDVFEAINNELIKNGQNPYANTRNLASGSLKQLDPKVTASRNLSFFAYTLGNCEGYVFGSQENVLNTFKEWGFCVSEYVILNTVADIDAYIDKVSAQRSALPYAIDGLVIKVNDFSEQAKLGFRSNSPKWAVAYKFPAQGEETQVLEVIWQVGRTGNITPVAKVTPVQVGGTTITSVTLHNRLEIERKDVMIGDYVLVRRAGDVIPEIVEVLVSKRDERKALTIEYPIKCPACGDPLKYEKTFIRCINKRCNEQIIQEFCHYVSRDAANIEGLSEQTIRLLVDKGLLVSLIDMYRLKYDDLMNLPRFGDKKARNLIDAIDKSAKNMTLSRFIYALGIDGVGIVTARDLAKKFGTIERLCTDVDMDAIISIPNIGEIVCDHICTFFIRNGAWVLDLVTEGFPHLFSVAVQDKLASNILQGKSFLFTGSIDIPRKQAEGMVIDNGGVVATSVSKNLDYLVVGEKAGSKLDKAKKLGVQLLSFDEFKAMLV